MSNKNNNIVGTVSVNVPLYQYENIEWLIFQQAQVGSYNDYHCECQVEKDSVSFGKDFHGENYEKIASFYGLINIEIETQVKIKMKNGVLVFDKPVKVQVYQHFVEWNSAEVFVKVF